jgi:predicted AlkP superfamily phosphohydrolase/phosphomutase
MLQDLADPRRGQRVFREVHLREEVFHGTYAEREPDIICLFAEGYGGVDLAANQLVVDIPLAGVPGGMHRQDGVWMLSGPDVQAGLRAHLDLQDVAPIIYHLLSVTVPHDMDGRVPAEIYKEETALSDRVCPTATFDLDRAFVLPLEAQQDSQTVMHRLRALGYVE